MYKSIFLDFIYLGHVHVCYTKIADMPLLYVCEKLEWCIFIKYTAAVKAIDVR